MKTKIQKKEEIRNEIFVGLDVHLNNWYATIMGEKIQDLKRTFEADAGKFVKYLTRKIHKKFHKWLLFSYIAIS